MTTIDTIKTSATETAAAAQERDRAIAEEQQAAAELLEQVIAIVRPALAAIGDSLPVIDVAIADGTRSEHRRSTRYVGLCDVTGREKPYLRADGVLCERSREDGIGGDKDTLTMREYASTIDFVGEWSPRIVPDAIETLASKLAAAAPGLKARAEKARKNAEKLRAISELLKK